jgi:hypothetical protein
MAEFRYHFYDLASGVRIDTLPVEDAQFTTELRGIGTLSGQIPLHADGLDTARVLEATIPDRTKIFVERDNALVWGGRLLPPRRYDSASGRVAIAAEETLGALALRFLPSLTFTGVDQLDIARALIAAMQAEVGGDMGLTYTGGLSGILRDRTYLDGDRTAALTALTDLSEVLAGFDFATQAVWGPAGTPLETILLGYPRLGRSGAAAGLVFEYNEFTGVAGAPGGNVAAYTWDDGPGLFTRSWAVCTTDEGTSLVAASTNADLLGQGYPLLEQTQQFEGITSQATLQAHADALSAYAGGHHVTAEFTVAAQPGIELGDWQLGDDVAVRLSDWRFPPDPATGAPGFDNYLRIVGASVTPNADGLEQYVFTMGDMIESL